MTSSHLPSRGQIISYPQRLGYLAYVRLTIEDDPPPRAGVEAGRADHHAHVPRVLKHLAADVARDLEPAAEDLFDRRRRRLNYAGHVTYTSLRSAPDSF